MNISHIPHLPGVYIFVDSKKTILYIGKAKNLAKRVSQYFTPGSVWKQDMVAKAVHVDFIQVSNESEALYLEDNLIKKHHPEYNRLLKGDNSYVYIRIGKGDFPQIMSTRYRKNDGATYIGPKHITGDLKKIMHYLRQIYKFRISKETEFRLGKLSSDFVFGLDAGWSVIAQMRSPKRNEIYTLAHKTGLIIDKSYDEYKKEYTQIVRSLVSFFEGDTALVTNRLMQDMQIAIDHQRYEYCGILRDIYKHFAMISEKQHVVLDPGYTGMMMRCVLHDRLRILVVIRIYEGKMIDIIRESKDTDDRSLESIRSSLEAEYGDMMVREHDNHTTYISAKMKKIHTIKREAIDTLIDGFVQSYIVSMTARDDTLMHDLLIHIQKKYHLTRLPYHIECVDISHFQGDWMSAGLSALQGGLPAKKHYRHYKVQLFADNKAGTSNDYLALQEIIVRRFGLKKSTSYDTLDTSGFPDVFVIDGGIGQLGIIRELCQIFPLLGDIIRHKTTFVSLGKGAARTTKGKNAGAIEYIYTYIDHNPTNDIQKIPLVYDQGDRVLTGLRDEAHRFANKYRTMQMKKEISM